MAYVVVCIAALGTAALTLFSGFGLGTLLLPVFALFFPLSVAVAATAVVHPANTLFKILLVGRHARLAVVAAFGVPATIAAIAGAWVLGSVSRLAPLAAWSTGGKTFEVMPVKLVIASLIFVFAISDLLGWFEGWRIDGRWLPLGGALSGFFGGLSGHQGALRSVFLINAGLGRDAFIGTGVVCAVLVAFSRLAVYSFGFAAAPVETGHLGRSLWGLVAAAIGCAFLGSFAGARLVKKVTLRAIEIVVGIGLVLLSAALAAGLV